MTEKTENRLIWGILLAAAVGLGMTLLVGCTPAQVAQGCALDALGQPVALAALAAAEPALAGTVTSRDAPVHQAIIDACAKAAAPAK
jgi:hypothetical protein